jgi:hypothetical protein
MILKEAVKTTGNMSSTRIVLFFGVLSCVTIGVMGIALNRDLIGTAAIITGILVPICGMKGYQSKQENHGDKTEP